MSISTSNACPVCQKSDRIQRVKSIVSSGTSHSSIYSDKSLFSVGSTTTSTTLAERLQCPPSLPEPGRGRWRATCGGIFLLYIGIQLVRTTITNSAEIANSSPFLIPVLFIAGLIMIAIPLRSLLGRILQKTSKKQEEIERKQAIDRIRQANQIAKDRWEHQLYYCYRDDCVFLPGHSSAAAPEQMQSVLYTDIPDPVSIIP